MESERPRSLLDPAPVPAERERDLSPTTARRTVTITGRGAERFQATRRRPPARRQRQRLGGRPERIAMWAVLLGVAMAIAAATSSHADVLSHVARTLGH